MEQVSANIGISGALVSAQTVENFRRPNVKHAQLEPGTFMEPEREPRKPTEIQSDMAAAFDLLCEQWDSVRKAVQPGGELWGDVSTARRRWILPVLEALGYRPQFQQAYVSVDEAGKLRFNLSHRAWEGIGPPYIHAVAPAQDLEQRAGGKGSLAPHDEMQRYLNASQIQQWGVVTNGRRLRILRDFHHTSVRGYIEFDLDGIFETRDRADFRALYRLAHVSRLVPREDGKTPLEHLYDESTAAGVAIGGKLRENVRAAIEDLANGFLRGHPEIIQELQIDSERAAKAFYEEILQVIYRILFLLYAEQRGLLPGRTQLYQESYSISALRARAERSFRTDDPHCDLWEGLKVTFHLMSDGNDALGVPRLGGELFGRGTERFIDRMRCPNGVLLSAVRHLALVEREKVLLRVSYVDLGVDELGSIYEALLDYEPRIAQATEDVPVEPGSNATRTVRAGEFFLDPRGMSRKSSGTYYTNPQLVDRLIQSALVPVMEERLSETGDDPQAQESALLDIKVVDPACGSGAFLIAATNTMGLRLARIRTGEEYPPGDAVDRARRDVLSHCIHGVDLNPTTVTLAKVSLWIAAAAKGEPLTFLDHRIRCGNSLIGATPELMEVGIPDEAFTPVTGDDKEYAKSVKKRNREERKAWAQGQGGVQPGLRVTLIEDQVDLDCYLRVGQLAPDDPEEARQIYESCREAPAAWSSQEVAATWTAAFFWPLDGSEPPPTEGMYRALLRKELGLPKRTADSVRELAEEYRFFHWHLEFPEVFNRENPGFDVVLGNPPWDRVKLQQQEFFEVRSPGIAAAPNAAARRRMIEALAESDDRADRALLATYERALAQAENISLFLRDSGRFPMGGRGDVNLYAVFAEHDRALLSSCGRAGLLLPTGIATDDTTKDLFGDIAAKGSLVSLRDFENSKGLFPGVHRSYKFCLLTMRGHNVGNRIPAEFAFFCTEIDHLEEEERRFTLTSEDFALFNPNTKTCPTFRSRRDSEIARKIYQRAGTLVREACGEDEEQNPWGIRFSTIFHMSGDSELFRTAEQLESMGCRLDGNLFRCAERDFLPLYEGKMFDMFDHRKAHVEVHVTNLKRPGQPDELSDEDHSDPSLLPMPRYWVSEQETVGRAGSSPAWLAFKNVTSPTNERTLVVAILPPVAASHSIQLIQPQGPSSRIALLSALLGSLVIDYVTRLKLGGINLSYFVVKQLPVVSPEYLEHLDLSLDVGRELVSRVIELTFTSHDMAPFARSLGFSGPPFVWNPHRRHQLRCEMDAIIAYAYRLGREDLEWVLDAQYPSESFRGLKQAETARWGEYRTASLVLDAYDRLVRGEGLDGAGVPAG